MRRGGEAGHVGADLGEDDAGGGRADPGDLIEAGDHVTESGHLRLDLGVEGGDVSLDRVDPGQHPRQQELVVPVERAPHQGHSG